MAVDNRWDGSRGSRPRAGPPVVSDLNPPIELLVKQGLRSYLESPRENR